MKKFFQKYWFLFAVAIVIIVIDQITKALIRANLSEGGFFTPIKWLPFLRFVNWNNTGVAFGMFQGMGWVFGILAFLVAGAIIYYFPKVSLKDPFIRWALALELSGALGNLIDRIILVQPGGKFLSGPVTDFISVGNFAVWNVADGCITVGVFLLVIGVWIQERREKKAKSIHSNDPAEKSE